MNSISRSSIDTTGELTVKFGHNQWEQNLLYQEEKQENKYNMDIERVISWFDRKTEKLIGEYNIDHINVDLIKNIIRPEETDPLMYDPYIIRKKHIEPLEKIIDIKFDLREYIYQIDCFQK